MADALSRFFVKNKSDVDADDNSVDNEVEMQVCMIVNNLSFSKTLLEKFKKETELDKDLSIIKQYVESGWPLKELIPSNLRFYLTIKDNLFVAEGLVFKDSLVLVPRSLRKEMLNLIHYGHFGVEKCKSRARSVLFWPHMNKEIEDMVLNCHICLSVQRSHSAEPLILRGVPEIPWSVLGTDIFHFKGKDYLLTIDYFSKYVEIRKLSNLSTEEIIVSLKSVFARFCIPEKLYSDNGP